MIEFNNVSFRYENKKESVIDSISFSVKPGECILLTGKSGCGKSTILNLINGIVPGHIKGELAGEIKVNGIQPNETSVQEISSYVGSIFQNPKSQFFNLDTTDELLFGLSNHKKPGKYMLERLDETKKVLHIEPLMDRNIFELSGGEKQKIACGSVYAFSPDIFVFDEPSSNLDMDAIEDIKNILLHLKSEGKTLIIAEHRVYYLMDIVDRVFYIESGVLEKKYSSIEFNSISNEERKEMGLRDVKKPFLSKSLLKKSTINSDRTEPNSGLELVNLKYAIKKTPIWEIPYLSLNKGEVTGIIGANGTGKTTLANCLCGLYKPKGEIKNTRSLKTKARRRLFSLVMQDVNHQLFTESVLHELMLMHKKGDEEKRREAETLAGHLGLSEYLAEHPLSLSGGQKQRVVIAASIMESKKYIIMDEPTSGLDFFHMRSVAKLIKQVAETKQVILISHDIEFINMCCDRVVELDKIAL